MAERNTDEEILQRRIRTQEWGEDTIEVALHEIERICEEVGIDEEVCEVAQAIYRRALKHKVIENRSITTLAASSVYAASKSLKKAYSPDEIAQASHSQKTTVNRTFTEMKEQLELNLGPVDPKKYVSRYCLELDLPEVVETKANDMVDIVAEEGGLSGRSPSGFAASAVYIASLLTNYRKTRSEVADVAGVSKRTISHTYQLQVEMLLDSEESDLEIPEED